MRYLSYCESVDGLLQPVEEACRLKTVHLGVMELERDGQRRFEEPSAVFAPSQERIGEQFGIDTRVISKVLKIVTFGIPAVFHSSKAIPRGESLGLISCFISYRLPNPYYSLPVIQTSWPVDELAKIQNLTQKTKLFFLFYAEF